MKNKNIEIYCSDYGREYGPPRDGPPVEVDLSKLVHFYSAMGEKQRRAVGKFIDYWEGDACARLFKPKAAIKVLPLDTVSENFGTDKLRINESVDKSVMAVWTIGFDLEREASELMSVAGKIMTGFLLDVAGSIALYDMHSELVEWIKREIAAPAGKFINGEFYPGIGSMDQDMMEKVTLIGDTERTIGVSAVGDSLLKPRKSQCSFLAFGASEHETEVRMSPCKPCTGKKCLYYQLGGCHMIMERDWEGPGGDG